jgi:hypothetical protein
MSVLLQDVVVTIVGLGAVATLVRHVFSIVRPRSAAAQCGACTACPSSQNVARHEMASPAHRTDNLPVIPTNR